MPVLHEMRLYLQTPQVTHARPDFGPVWLWSTAIIIHKIWKIRNQKSPTNHVVFLRPPRLFFVCARLENVEDRLDSRRRNWPRGHSSRPRRVGKLARQVRLAVWLCPLGRRFELFQKTGTALPQETVDVLQNECDGALFRSRFVSHSEGGWLLWSPIVAFAQEIGLVRQRQDPSSLSKASADPWTWWLCVKTPRTCTSRKKRANTWRRHFSGRGHQKNHRDRVGQIAKVAYDIALLRQAIREACRRPSRSIRNLRSPWPIKSNVLSVSTACSAKHARRCTTPTRTTAHRLRGANCRLHGVPYVPGTEIFDVVVAPNLYGDIFEWRRCGLGGLWVLFLLPTSATLCHWRTAPRLCSWHRRKGHFQPDRHHQIDCVDVGFRATRRLRPRPTRPWTPTCWRIKSRPQTWGGSSSTQERWWTTLSDALRLESPYEKKNMSPRCSFDYCCLLAFCIYLICSNWQLVDWFVVLLYR